jgi:hypothetical protein
MQVIFPDGCILGETQKHALGMMLSKDDFPCDGCPSQENCSAYADQKDKQGMLGDPTACPFHLTELDGSVSSPELIGGAFIHCSQNGEEWAFSFDFEGVEEEAIED